MGNSVTVLLGNGLGGFSAAQGSPFMVGSNPASVVVGDFNGDGFADLATANSGTNTVTVLLGNGKGVFAPAPASPFTVGNAPQWLTVADFNGDGIEDIAAANTNDGTVTVLLGSLGTPQTINFGALSNLSYGAAPFTVSAACHIGSRGDVRVDDIRRLYGVRQYGDDYRRGTRAQSRPARWGALFYEAAPMVSQEFHCEYREAQTDYSSERSAVNQFLSGTSVHAANLSWTASTTPGVTYNVYRFDVCRLR